MRPIFFAFICFCFSWAGFSCESYFEPEERELAPLEVISSWPQMNETDVPTDAPVRIRFNKHLDANFFSTQAVTLHSGSAGKWVMAYYDPLDMALVVWTSKPLLPNTVWELYIDDEILALDGSSLTPLLVTRFRTGDTELKEPVFATRSYSEDVKPIFDSHCIQCHGQANYANLDLRNFSSISRTAMSISSEQWPALDRIAQDKPGASYLVLKLIGGDNVSGRIMPRSLDGDDRVTPLSRAEKRIIVDWILSNARF